MAPCGLELLPVVEAGISFETSFGFSFTASFADFCCWINLDIFAFGKPGGLAPIGP